ncbi:MAG: response regulator transcription factor [Pirellulales bacterium]
MTHPASPSDSTPSATGNPQASLPNDGVLTCVLVEDQSMFLDLLSGMLMMRGGMRILACARTVAEGVEACTRHRPDLLLLDLALPDGDGIEVARRCTEMNHTSRVIVLSGHSSDFVCPEWLDGHLHAVISKAEAFQALQAELDDLQAGYEKDSDRTLRDAEAETRFTPREAEVFSLIGEGLTSRAIGLRLSISEHTVQTHRKNLAAKLGTQGDELTRRAVAYRQAFYRAADG